MAKVVTFPNSTLPPEHDVYLMIKVRWQGDDPNEACLKFARTVEAQIGSWLPDALFIYGSAEEGEYKSPLPW